MTWTVTVKKLQEPLIIYPHANLNSSKPVTKSQSVSLQSNGGDQTHRAKQKFRPINNVEWRQQKDGDDYIIFSGGMKIDGEGPDIFTPICLTIVKNKSPFVVEMEDKILTFNVLVNSPYCNDAQDPYAVCVLLQNDLVMVDLLSPRWIRLLLSHENLYAYLYSDIPFLKILIQWKFKSLQLPVVYIW